MQCIYGCNELSFTLQGAPPQITQPYQAPDVCSTRNTGVDGGEEGGAAHLVYSTLAVTLVALLALLL